MAGVIAAVATVGGGVARADQLEGIGQVFATVELLSPDVRLELDGGGHGWSLAWPLSIRTTPLHLAGPVHVGLTHQVELQYRFAADDAVRASVSERMRFGAGGRQGQWLPVLELGAVAGQDGLGGLVGAGLGYGVMDEGVLIGLLGRRVMTTEGDRTELTLDVQIPINVD